MGILLTDEEIEKLTKPSPYETYFSHYPHIVALAQLKKVVEWLEGLPTDGHDKWYFYHRDLADMIKKEAGL